MAGVLCSGNIVMDILVRPVDRVDTRATTLVESLEQHLGGNGASTCCALGTLGTRVRLLGMVGSDAFGNAALGRLASAGVDTSAVCRGAAGTAATVVMVNSAGERVFLHRLGVSGEMALGAADFDRELRGGWSHYHLATPFALPRMREAQPELLRMARAAGLTTSLDTQWDSQNRWMEDLGPCLPYTDILFANEDECGMLTGSTDPATASAFLRARGAWIVVLKRGARGCYVRAPGVEACCPAFRVPVVDTTGAGDCFAGGFLAARQRGYGLEEAGRFANAVAALAIQKLGATEGLLPWEETARWLVAAAPVEHSSNG